MRDVEARLGVQSWPWTGFMGYFAPEFDRGEPFHDRRVTGVSVQIRNHCKRVSSGVAWHGSG
jgi:hypothetical protein